MRLRTGDQVASKYTVTQKLGEGFSGKVYAAVDCKNRKYAIKLEKDADGALLREKLVYDDLAFDEIGDRAIGIPRMYHSGQQEGHDILVLEMLGSSLKDRVRDNGGRLSLKTCLILAVQLITRLEHIHNCGYLHRDIKPDNILTGRSDRYPRRVYIADYGLAEKYRDPITGLHRQFGRNDGFSGTCTYASVNVMRGVRPSRRDDLESLAYSLVQLRNGSLPWPRERDIVGPVNHDAHRERVLEIKMVMPMGEFAEGFPGMYNYFMYVRNLRYGDRPKYSYLKACFNGAMEELGIQDDGNFDWMQQD